jgi:hypothetical protein
MLCRERARSDWRVQSWKSGKTDLSPKTAERSESAWPPAGPEGSGFPALWTAGAAGVVGATGGVAESAMASAAEKETQSSETRRSGPGEPARSSSRDAPCAFPPPPVPASDISYRHPVPIQVTGHAHERSLALSPTPCTTPECHGQPVMKHPIASLMIDSSFRRQRPASIAGRTWAGSACQSTSATTALTI